MSGEGRRLLLGVTGSVAAFKAVELASNLTQEGWKVRAVITPWGCKFVGPLSFSSVTGERAYTDQEVPDPGLGSDHVSLARWAELIAVVPATANTIAKLANGLADNLLTLTVLAFRGPVLIAPAMNVAMYESLQVQENVRKLKQWGYVFVGPAEGRLACGEEGRGRLADLEDIKKVLKELAEEKR